ncbi:MAG: site-specific integrase [Planctomycetaceae bacterium]|nr:site-specific integrase [Planctomycetaceae bacterium]
MPRKIELTWQPGAAGRQGRWKKKYKGQALYFAYGTSKSDLPGYRNALEAWHRKKIEIDAEQALIPKPFQPEYEQAVDDWTQVLHWSLEHGDTNNAQLARTKIDSLRDRLAAGKLAPLNFTDSPRSLSAWPPHVIQEIKSTMLLVARDAADATPNITLPRDVLAAMDGSPARIRGEIWQDRIESQRGKNRKPNETLESLIEAYLNGKRAQVAVGKLSAGRCDVLRVHLHHFREWLGRRVSVRSITGKVVADYHAELISGIVDKRWSADYAKDHFSAMKSFVRWLWRTDAIESLPRNLDSKDLTIGKKLATPAVFTIEEVTSLRAAATDRTKLYILLMANCGMTQQDISDLLQSEVDWEAGSITRKRSKTADHKGVPIVTYVLWKETFRLLRQERAKTGPLALANEQNGPLKSESLTADGKLEKIDNIASAFARLRRKTKIKKPPKLLRKTSASLLKSNKEFAGIEVLFLGHAPDTIADRHYAQAPQQTLDEAIAWLGQQYGVA